MLLFSLTGSWRTLGVFALANVPSVGLAVYATIDLTESAERMKPNQTLQRTAPRRYALDVDLN